MNMYIIMSKTKRPQENCFNFKCPFFHSYLMVLSVGNTNKYTIFHFGTP